MEEYKLYNVHINTGVSNYVQNISADSPKRAVHIFAYNIAKRFNVTEPDLSNYILKHISALEGGYSNIGGYIYAAALDTSTGKVHEYKITCSLGDE